MLKCFSSFQPDTKCLFQGGGYLYFEASLIQIYKCSRFFYYKNEQIEAWL